MNPYKILKIRKNASPEAIQTQYRRLAKVNHPDHNPGDDDAAVRFAEIHRAYEVLNDPVRRANYDSTGCIDDAKAVNPDQEFCATIAPVLAGVIAGIVNAGHNVESVNLVEAMGNTLKDVQKQLKVKLDGLTKARAVVEKTVSRFTVVGGEGENLLAGIAKDSLQMIDNDLKVVANEQEKFKRVAEGLKRFGYLFTPATSKSLALLMSLGGQTATTTFKFGG